MYSQYKIIDWDDMYDKIFFIFIIIYLKVVPKVIIFLISFQYLSNTSFLLCMCMTVMLTKNWKSLCAILSLFLCQFKKLFEFIPLGILIQVSCMHEAIFEQLSTVCWLIFGLCYQYKYTIIAHFYFPFIFQQCGKNSWTVWEVFICREAACCKWSTTNCRLSALIINLHELILLIDLSIDS